MYTPERTCIACRKVCPDWQLARLIAPDGQVRLAPRGTGDGREGKRGRGAWVHVECIAEAIKGGAMGRAFKRQVAVSDAKTLLAQMHFAEGQPNGQGN